MAEAIARAQRDCGPWVGSYPLSPRGHARSDAVSADLLKLDGSNLTVSQTAEWISDNRDIVRGVVTGLG